MGPAEVTGGSSCLRLHLAWKILEGREEEETGASFAFYSVCPPGNRWRSKCVSDTSPQILKSNVSLTYGGVYP